MVTSTGAQYGSLESMDFVILIHPQLGDPGTPLRRQLSSFSGKSDVLKHQTDTWMAAQRTHRINAHHLQPSSHAAGFEGCHEAKYCI